MTPASSKRLPSRRPPLSTAPNAGKTPVFVSVGTKLTVPVVLLVVAVAVGVYFGLVKSSQTNAMRSKEVAADMVVKLTAASVSPAVVFGDELETKRAIDDLARNTEITDVELWGVNEDAKSAVPLTPLSSFHRPGGRSLGSPKGMARRRYLETDSLVAVEPVVDLDQKVVAMLSVRFSTLRESAQLAALSRQILWVSFGTSFCVVLAILAVIQRIVAPLERLRKAAKRLADGGDPDRADLRAQAPKTEDEVVQLATAFREMASAVRDREARLEIRTAELRLILNSVHQGFLTAQRDGVFLPERSAIVETWLGPLPEGARVWDLIALIDSNAAAWTEAAWEQMVEEVLPLDVGIDQLPKRLSRKGQHFELAYHTVVRDGQVERVVIVLTDVTAEAERQLAIAEQHEFSALVDQFVRDRRGFSDFWSEACALVNRILRRSEDDAGESLRRDVHTLKGNAGFFGLTRVSALCHSIEDGMRDRGEDRLNAEESAALGGLWEALRGRIEPLMQGTTAFLEISEQEYGGLLRAIENGASIDAVAELVRGLQHEPTALRLSRAKETLLAACRKLGKATPEILVEHNDLRLPSGPFSPFWSVFTHVMNNAADHGLEANDERKLAGKPAAGRIRLRTAILGDELLVEVIDDGRGVDWEKVEQLAKERGLAHRTARDLELALLSQGFSMKQSVSDLSGRGVGLSAVSSVVSALGGSIEIASEFGKGAAWRFRLPLGGVKVGLAEREATGDPRLSTARSEAEFVAQRSEH